MEVGVEVWIKDTKGDQSWVPSIIHSKERSEDGKLTLIARDEYGEDFKYIVKDENDDVEDLKLRNAATESDVENLISLPYLHEPAILYCLEKRYALSDIYTYTGPILIAMNPFKKVPLYSNQILEVYYNSGLLRSQGIESGTPLPPHVYAIADAAYRDMMQSVHGHSLGGPPSKGGGTKANANHSILISGESGAGKTESTKIVLRYLTTVGNSSSKMETESGSVMDKVLQSNPILEAFGNARTIRNDNSSRFGKFIELNFNKRGHLVGGTIRTYLLEKVRLPSQQYGERNFHVFYQLCMGSNDEERMRWGLERDNSGSNDNDEEQSSPMDRFEYLLRGGIFQLKSIDDEREFAELKHALNTLNFALNDQQNLFDLTAALLHLGQLEFSPVQDAEGDGSVVAEDAANQESLRLFSVLSGLAQEEITRTLTVRTIVARSESYQKKLTCVQASDARDALSKAIYGRIFEWIVRTINLSIEVDAKQIRSSIGVLDIFGFECFVHNSFEQLCINYTNETLQQQFNQYIFKMEQIEYQRESIEWSFIEFPDNQDCLDLIEHKLTGILAMIDDECRLPQASDVKLAGRMHKAYADNKRFSASAAQKRDNQFCVNHYAGAVVYSTVTFVEKNKDELPKEATTLLLSSNLPLLKELFTAFGPAAKGHDSQQQGAPTSRGGTSGGDKKAAGGSKSSTISSMNSVGTQFKGQLNSLMDSVYATTPHYIRCLKPNDQNIPDSFNRIRITEQLRYGGVLEAVRVARSGFPVRLVHADFFQRYRSLANPFSPASRDLPAFWTKDHQSNTAHAAELKRQCETLLVALWDESVPDEDSGATAEDVPVQLQQQRLQQQRAQNRRRSRIADMKIWQSRSVVAKESVQLGLTKVFLRKPAHDVLEGRRSRRIMAAARRIQSQFRCYSVRSWYARLVYAQKLLQRMARGFLARSLAMKIRRERACLRVQTHYRRHCQRSHYLLLRGSVVALQCQFRVHKAQEKVGSVRLLWHTTRLQRIMRGILARSKCRRYLMAVTTLQNRMRKIRAKVLLKELRASAKDVGRLQQSNEALKSEIEALKARAASENERMRRDMEKQLSDQAAAARSEELSLLKAELENAYKLLEIERELHKQSQEKLEITENKLLEQSKALQAANQSISERDQELSASVNKLIETEESLATVNARLSYSMERAVSPSSNSSADGSSVGGGMVSSARHNHPHHTVPNGSAPPLKRQPASRRNSARSPPTVLEEEEDGSFSHSHAVVSGPSRRSSGRFSLGSGAAGSGSRPASRAGSMRRSSFGDAEVHLAAEQMRSGSGDSTGTGGDLYQQALESLDKEIRAREVLENEVARLRHISMDYKSQIDQLRHPSRAASPTETSSRPASPPSPSKPTAANGVPVRSARQVTSRANVTGGAGSTSVLAARHRPISPVRREGAIAAAHSKAAALLAGEPESSAASTAAVASPQQWSQAWDDEDDSSGGGAEGLSSLSGRATPDQLDGRNPLAATRTASGRAVAGGAVGNSTSTTAVVSARNSGKEMAATSAVTTFEKNLEGFRNKLKLGVKARVWEGEKVSNAEITLKMDQTNRLLTFDSGQYKRAFALFQSRPDIAPIGLAEIVEFLSGSEVSSDASDQSLLLTIVTKMDSSKGSSRIIALKFANRDQRNSMLTGLRTLAADSHLHTTDSNTPGRDPNVHAGRAAVTSSPLGQKESNPMAANARRPTRRLSVRDVVLEEKVAQSSGTTRRGSTGGSGGVRSAIDFGSRPTAGLNRDGVDTEAVKADDAAVAAVLEDLHKKVHAEQEKNERIVIQMVVLTNDLNERDEQIALLKKKEEHYEQTLAERDNMYKQDAMVRMQLGKRLEQVLMDKEEAMEQLAAMKDQLESIQEGFKK